MRSLGAGPTSGFSPLVRTHLRGSERPTQPFPQRAVSRAVTTQDHHTLFASLDAALALLERHRTPDPAFVIAYDTLKQSRAMLVKVLHPAAGAPPAASRDSVAA